MYLPIDEDIAICLSISSIPTLNILNTVLNAMCVYTVYGDIVIVTKIVVKMQCDQNNLILKTTKLVDIVNRWENVILIIIE